jgi:ElaA protein
MVFSCKAFTDLSVAELHNIYRLRSEIFVVEQKCAYQDVDEKDPLAHHLLMHNDGALSGYLRLIPPGISYTEASIGRVAVPVRFRGRQFGRRLMEKGIEEAKRLYGPGDIMISAQCYLQTFYESLGFSAEGSAYPEDDIPHIRMRLQV